MLFVTVMVAVMDVVPSTVAPVKTTDKPWLFQKGHKPYPNAGRPKGSRDARTIYLESLPLKAQQWVKSTAPAVLIDARKIALPIEGDDVLATLAPTLVVFGQLPTTTPSVMPQFPVVESSNISVTVDVPVS